MNKQYNNIIRRLNNGKNPTYHHWCYDFPLIMSKLEHLKPNSQKLYIQAIIKYLSSVKHPNNDVIKKYRHFQNKIIKKYCLHKRVNIKLNDNELITKEQIIDLVNKYKKTLDVLDVIYKQTIDNYEYRILKKYIMLKLFCDHQLTNIQVTNIKLLDFDKEKDNYLLLKDNHYYIYLNDPTNKKYFNGLELKLSKNISIYLKKLIYFSNNNNYLLLQDDRYTKLTNINISNLYRRIFYKEYKNININYRILSYIWIN